MTLIESPVGAPTKTDATPPERVSPKTLETAEILERAAEIIETTGWTRGSLTTFNRHCAVGAISKASGGKTVVYPTSGSRGGRAVIAFARFLAGAYADRHMSATVVTDWNDHTAKSGKEVARKLREAAAALLAR